MKKSSRGGVQFVNIEIKPSAADIGKVEGELEFASLAERSCRLKSRFTVAVLSEVCMLVKVALEHVSIKGICLPQLSDLSESVTYFCIL